MINWTEIIEQDDIETFKKHFVPENWKQTITQIENYAGTNEYIKTVTFNDADVFKYSLHCGADKIFDYLLPFVEVDKHGENYGWPLLAMAVKKSRYDYANKIIKHPSFDPLPMYHMNLFGYIKSYANPQQHIDFLFNYLEHFDKWTFRYTDLTYYLTSLVCYSEDTFQRLDKYYKKVMGNDSAYILDIYKDKMNILGEEIFQHNYNKRMIEKLKPEDILSILDKAYSNDDNSRNRILLSSLFESESAKEAIGYLLQQPKALMQYFDNNSVVINRLNLECVLLLMENGLDIWKEETNNKYDRAHPLAPIDFLIEIDDIHDEKTWYFLNNYTHEVLARLEKRERTDNDAIRFCQHKILDEKLSEKGKKSLNKI